MKRVCFCYTKAKLKIKTKVSRAMTGGKNMKDTTAHRRTGREQTGQRKQQVGIATWCTKNTDENDKKATNERVGGGSDSCGNRESDLEVGNDQTSSRGEGFGPFNLYNHVKHGFPTARPIQAHHFPAGPYVPFERSNRNDPLVGCGDRSVTLR